MSLPLAVAAVGVDRAGARPRSWAQLVGLIAASAGLEPGEELPGGLWLEGMLEEVAGLWGLRKPPERV